MWIISNDTDLEAALCRMDEIWNARPGDDDWEERKELIDKIEAYENEHFSISDPDPVEAANFRKEQEFGVFEKEAFGSAVDEIIEDVDSRFIGAK
jgi:antitoxin component HigA of HigAB toxin-antitoxin module